MGENKETLGFQAEVKQLLRLMIHSLYSNKEIFLRELVSNASDACDRLRFEAIARPELLESRAEPAIRIAFDKDARSVTVSDDGIGMSRDDAVAHLGTIARSGTREFLANLTGDQQKDAQLIGQFGVGFYSAFIVADRVTVLTRRAGLPASQAVRWESDGAGEFSVEPAEREAPGTDVTLHLRAGEDELLSDWKLRSIVTRYSDHISLPIRMQKDGGEWETVNQASALWARPKSEVSEEQYKAFYKHVSHDFGEPLAWTHNRVEGRTEYTQLLFIPEHAPFDLWDRQQRRGVRLYVRRVFIMDDAEQLLPAYLRFVRGVIDSADLPLNVSREILQESRDVRSIREGSTKRVLALLDDLAANRKDKYAKFWSEFGQVLKEGLGEDHANREALAKLLRFASTAADSAEQTVALADYVARMKPGQEKVYYVTADSWDAARSSPQLEIFKKKGIEVLLLSDRVDEWLLGFLTEYEGKPLVSVARGGLDLGALADAGEKAAQERSAEAHKALVEKLKAALGERVKDVRVTLRLTDSPSCLVADERDPSGHLQRLFKAAGQKAPAGQPILELNPDHALFARMAGDQARLADWAHLLFEQALLSEGGQLDDPVAFVKRINRLLLEH